MEGEKNKRAQGLWKECGYDGWPWSMLDEGWAEERAEGRDWLLESGGIDVVAVFVVIVVQSLSHVQLFATPYTAACQAPLSFTISRVCSNSHPLSWWCYLTISSSATLYSSCSRSFPAPGSFSMSWFFTSDGQSAGASASASVLPMNIQSWFSLGWTSWISLQSEGLSRVFSNSTVQKHQFFGAQPSLWSSSHIHTWRLEKL